MQLTEHHRMAKRRHRLAVEAGSFLIRQLNVACCRPQYPMAIYPTPEQMKTLLTGPADRPVVMVNLLRFKAAG
jgi:hypothetical protein